MATSAPERQQALELWGLGDELGDRFMVDLEILLRDLRTGAASRVTGQ